MCGIVGYIGKQEAYPILIKGLQRLEYRGYDSSGVALMNNSNELNIYKSRGKVAELENHTLNKDISGHIGIAHTRWATHGEPNDVNAHPHYSQSHQLALIHNGIIENYKVLKDKLINEGYTFKSETDTEVLVQWIEFIKEYNKIDDLVEAVQVALSHVIGAYAIAILDKNTPDRLICARKSSPLVVGIGKDEFFIASDATPIVEYTDQVVYLNDEEMAVLELGKELSVCTLGNVKRTPKIKTIEMSLDKLEKGDYDHFMLKEIFEQSSTIRNCMKGRVHVKRNSISISGFTDNKEKFMNAKRIIITACGTSWHAAQIGMYAIEEYTRIPVVVEYSSEFRYRNPVINSDDVVIAISQSGETADTLAALELAKENGAFCFGICNVVGSSIPRVTDSGCYTHVGPEIGVASTKAFTGQVTVLLMLALAIAQEKKTISDEKFTSVLQGLGNLPSQIESILSLNKRIRHYAHIFTYASNFLYLGRGYNFPVALEGALKLKEISYIHAEGYPAAEMKHGPIALINEEMPVVVIATKRGNYDKVVSNIQEIVARKGKVIAIVNECDTTVKEMADFCMEIPDTEECLSPILASIPLQLLAYHIAVIKGCDVDQPRNLAKSVTVE